MNKMEKERNVIVEKLAEMEQTRNKLESERKHHQEEKLKLEMDFKTLFEKANEYENAKTKASFDLIQSQKKLRAALKDKERIEREKLEIKAEVDRWREKLEESMGKSQINLMEAQREFSKEKSRWQAEMSEIEEEGKRERDKLLLKLEASMSGSLADRKAIFESSERESPTLNRSGNHDVPIDIKKKRLD